MDDRPNTLTGLIDRLAETHGAKTAIIDGDQSLSYAVLRERSQQAAGGLAKLGVCEGDRVAFWLPNGATYLTAYFACVRLGAVCVAVNTRFRASEIGDIVGRSGAKTLIVDPAFRLTPVKSVLKEIGSQALPALQTIVCVGESGFASPWPGLEAIDYAAVAASEPTDDVGAGAEAPCNIFTTSGTTKAPKLVLHAQRGITAHACDVAAGFGFEAPGTTILQALPLCGVFGLAQALGCVAGGGTLIMMHEFEAAGAASLCRAHSVTHLFGSDDMIARMLDAAPDHPPFPSLKFAGYAAFNSSLDDLPERANARGVRLIGLYGMSECMALFAARDPGLFLPERAKAGGGCISPDGLARVRDTETGELAAPGQSGELEVRGPSLMIGYDGNAEATADALTGDGFLRTGDLALMEEDGSFEYLTRLGDTLRLGGFLVAPSEIEAHLQAHAKVEAAQVVAAATPSGNRPVAFVIVVPGSRPDEDDLALHCESLAKFKRPVRFIVLKAFPVTESANGVKIQRAKLRAEAEALI